MTLFLNVVVTGLLIGAIYGLVALGFVLIYKACGIFNFAQGDFLMFGAYIMWTFLLLEWLPWPIALLLSCGIAALIGIGIERWPVRPMVGQSLLAVVMMTMGFMYLLRGAAIIGWGNNMGGNLFYRPIFAETPVRFGGSGLMLSQQLLWGAAIVALLFILFTLFFQRSMYGLAMRAAAEDQLAAGAAGISSVTTIRWAWAIGLMVAVVGGFLLGTLQGLGLGLGGVGFRAIPAAILGGMESVHGAVIGGLIIGVVESLSAAYIGYGSGTIAAFVVMVVVILVRPNGLFGYEVIERV